MRTAFLAALVAASGCSMTQTTSSPQVTVSELAKSVDPEVRLDRKPVPDSKNGWRIAEQAAQAFGKSPKGIPDLPARPSAQDLAKARKQLAPLQESLRLIGEAVERPIWAAPPPREDVIPGDDNGIIRTFPVLATFKSLEKALVARARVDLADRNGKAARDLATAFLVGKRLVGGQSELIHHLVGIACEAIAARRIQGMANDPALSEGELRNLLAVVQSDPASHFDETLKVEFNDSALRLFASVPDPAKRESPKAVATLLGLPPELFKDSPISFDRRETVRDASKLYAVVVRNSRRPWGSQEDVDRALAEATKGLPDTSGLESTGFSEDEAPQPSPEQVRSLKIQISRVPNGFGKLLIRELMPVFAQAQAAEDRRLAFERATAVVLAASIELRATGHGPSKLAELYDWGLSRTCATDPFSGRDFRFEPSRNVFWSVGQDGRDDGGTDAPWRAASARDIVWSIDGHEAGAETPPKRAAAGFPPSALE